jgi:hypothetical protein
VKPRALSCSVLSAILPTLLAGAITGIVLSHASIVAGSTLMASTWRGDSGASTDSARSRISFASEFGCGFRLGPEVEVGGDPENRGVVLWDFGPIFALSRSDGVGLMGHVSYSGPDNPRAGIMVRWHHSLSDRKSLDLSAGWAAYEPGKSGGDGRSMLAMGTLNFRNVWLPTLLIQVPNGEADDAIRVFPTLKVGSSAGLLLGVLVPLAAFAIVSMSVGDS